MCKVQDEAEEEFEDINITTEHDSHLAVFEMSIIIDCYWFFLYTELSDTSCCVKCQKAHFKCLHSQYF